MWKGGETHPTKMAKGLCERRESRVQLKKLTSRLLGIIDEKKPIFRCKVLKVLKQNIRLMLNNTIPQQATARFFSGEIQRLARTC